MCTRSGNSGTCGQGYDHGCVPRGKEDIPHQRGAIVQKELRGWPDPVSRGRVPNVAPSLLHSGIHPRWT